MTGLSGINLEPYTLLIKTTVFLASRCYFVTEYYVNERIKFVF